LSASYRSEEIFYGKLVDSCKCHPATNIACSTTPRGDTSIDFINRAKANISTWKASQGMKNNPQYQQYFEPENRIEDSFYTDRRFQGSSNRGRREPQSNHQLRNSENQRRNYNQERQQARKRLKDIYHRQYPTYISEAEFNAKFDLLLNEIEASNQEYDFVEQLAAITINEPLDSEHFLLDPEEKFQL
ncbi:putative glycosyl, partial [Erysiphe neolycopersici]